MRLRQCDNCGTQMETDVDWLTLKDESEDQGTGIERFVFSSAARIELCSWKCVTEFAQLKTHEQEMQR